MKTIMILANKYLNKIEATTCTFLQQLAWSL